MARLGPGIGMEQIDPLEAGIGQPFQHVDHIAHVQPYVRQSLAFDMAERADHAIEEGLAADEAMARSRRRLEGKMLTFAEADLQFERARIAEQAGCIERSLG